MGKNLDCFLANLIIMVSIEKEMHCNWWKLQLGISYKLLLYQIH